MGDEYYVFFNNTRCGGTGYYICGTGAGGFVSFRVLNVPDLTADGSFVLGAAVSAVLCTFGHPFLGIPLAFLAAAGAGCVTSLMSSKFKIQPILAGILTMLALYSVNLQGYAKQAEYTA